METKDSTSLDDHGIEPSKQDSGEKVVSNVLESTGTSLNSLPASNEENSISPSRIRRRANMDRMRSSIKHESIILKGGSFSLSDYGWSEKRPKSFSTIATENSFCLDSRKHSVENCFTLRELSTKDGVVVISKEKSHLNEIFVQKAAKLAFMDQLVTDLEDKTKESIHFIEGNFSEFYEELETIGQGCSGVVKKCVHKASGQVFAVKIISIRHEERLLIEIKQFNERKKLFNNLIINVFELYVDMFKEKLFSVMEFVDAPDLQKHLEKFGRFDEVTAALIFKQILLAVQYLHCKAVCHRDLQLNNILASKDGKLIRILDLDVAKFIKYEKKYCGLTMENMKMLTPTGVLSYLAPECFAEHEYTEAIDIWSLGIVLYAMLTGHLPFEAENKEDLIKQIMSGAVNTTCEMWQKISSDGKDLINRLLQVNYKKRITPFEALAHEWILKNTSDGKKIRSLYSVDEICSPLRLKKGLTSKASNNRENKLLLCKEDLIIVEKNKCI